MRLVPRRRPVCYAIPSMFNLFNNRQAPHCDAKDNTQRRRTPRRNTHPTNGTAVRITDDKLPRTFCDAVR